MMPELGFGPEDNDRLVASYSGGWQMRMCLGKILLQVCVGCVGGVGGREGGCGVCEWGAPARLLPPPTHTPTHPHTHTTPPPPPPPHTTTTPPTHPPMRA